MSGILFDPNGELIDPCAHPDDIVAQMNGESPSLDTPRPLKRTKTMKTTQGAAAAKKPKEPEEPEELEEPEEPKEPKEPEEPKHMASPLNDYVEQTRAWVAECQKGLRAYIAECQKGNKTPIVVCFGRSAFALHWFFDHYIQPLHLVKWKRKYAAVEKRLAFEPIIGFGIWIQTNGEEERAKAKKETPEALFIEFMKLQELAKSK